ncbi:MAG: hypothetical protein DRI95_03630 [Bacteroidetes bacterium]|nr:MAG: hypothetical protein DRI95_03630 [Bacteroidota bacterium]
MIKQAKILLIGGATRNVGKTNFSCAVIKEFSKVHSIIGLKIKTLYQGDSFFHGKDHNPLIGNYRIIEEFDNSGDEDTMRMLKAGAKQVFRIKVKSEFIKKAFDDFLQQIPDGSFILCESNSLRKVIKPDVFLMIKHKNSNEIKPSAKELEPLADKIILTDGVKHDFDIDNIGIENRKWVLKR